MPMERTRTLCVSIVLGAALAGCGGRQGLSPADDGDLGGGVDGGAPAPSAVGPIDLSQAPAQLALHCDQGVGALAFVNPCQVGLNLANGGTTPGFHETECHLVGAGDPIVWAFLLPLAQIAAHPDRALSFPADFPTSPTSGSPAIVGGKPASVSSVAGTMSFSRVDPTARAFIARFQGAVTWTRPTGSTFSCALDGPFWGAPGSFL
jgi:hypothetical protein